MAIPDHFTIQFGKNFELAVQQTHSRFRQCAIVETGCTGEAKTHNLALAVSDQETTGERFGKTNLQELDTEKRWIRPRMFDLATGEPKWDEELLAPTVLPGGKHIEAHQAAYARRLDSVFIEGLLGENQKGKAGATAANLPSANVVAHDFVATGSAANAGLNVDKLIRAKRILTDNESYGDDARARGITLWGAMTPEMEEQLLFLANSNVSAASNRLFSRDFLPPVIDADGHISSFLGIRWMRSTQLPLVSGERMAAVWTSDAVHLDIWGDITTTVDRRPDLKNAVQFLSQYSFNACRSEDKKVVKIETTPA